MDAIAETRRALRALDEMPDGAARVLAADTLVRRVREQGPEEMLPKALLQLVRAYVFGADGQEVFTPFAEVLRLYDTHPEYFDEDDTFNLFWAFKWIGDSLTLFPEVDPELARSLLDEMERRFRLAGYGMAAVAKAQYSWAVINGDQAEAERAWNAWNSAGDDMDCPYCRRAEALHRLVRQQRYDEAIELGVLEGAKCNRQPAGMHLEVAKAHLYAGNAAACDAHLGISMATHNSTLRDVQRVGDWFELLARGNRLEDALAMLRTVGAGAVDGQGSPFHRLKYCLAVLRGLRAHPGAGELPTGIPALPTAASLADACEREAATLAAAFDRSAGNSRWADALAATRKSRVLLDLTGVDVADTAVRSQAAEDAQGAAVASDPFTAAEVLAQQERWDEASLLYRQAAFKRENAGDILGAGVAFAEEAQAAAMTGHVETAAATFYRAWENLTAAGADPGLLIQVAYAWANSEAQAVQRRGANLIPAGHSVLDAIDHLADVDTDAESQDDAFRSAQVHDIRARYLASRGETAEAAAEAVAAGEQFGTSGAIREAADAFLMAARLQRALGRYHDAEWAYESVIEALVATSQRSAVPSVLDEFVALLKATGQHERAEQVLQEYMGLN